ncbi:IclR family transcriptional regulator [uncultured Ferrovibrio sp.]|jgi:Transcriptional regulator|uniref:IclR family transcriptional regulator n=1 Tax=uncultured Ferrovibrio sp. TaxID=1576913 RepID=UPI0026165A50|nr:IclR family transcriptional regulator [uncultured Ferrovibrio sp.]
MSADEVIPQGKYVVPALAQGLSILSLFSRERPSLTAPEIAQKLSLSRTTVFRLLHTLQLMGYVRREPDERHFSLGPALLSRGFEYLASLDIIEVAQPILQRLRDETGLSAHMAVRDGREIVYVARFPARSTVASNVNIGTRFPIHATVMGRMMICEYSDEQLAALFPTEPLQRFSEQTPTTLAALKEMLKKDRERGYAVSQSFFERGVSSIAAPVRDGAGNIVAAINITAVDAYIELPAMHGALKDAVLAAAAEITRWLNRDMSRELQTADMSTSTSGKKTRRSERVHA